MKRRKKRVFPFLLCLFLCLGLLPAGALAASTVTVKVELTADYSAAYEELELLNSLRREHGLSELVMDEAMMDMALRRAAECAISFSHTRPNGEPFETARPSGPAYQKRDMGENILYALNGADAATATENWYHSPGHKANMLEGGYAAVGIACVRDLEGHTYWVQDFTEAAGTEEASPSSGQERIIFSVEAEEQVLDVQLSTASLNMEAGEKELVYVRNGATPVVPDIIRTSDDSVASLSLENGAVCVSAVGEGTATLTLGFAGHSATVTVTVARPVQLEGMTLVQPDGGFAIEVGERAYTTVRFLPEGSPSYPVTWDVTDPSILSLTPNGSSCTLTGLAPGTTTFTVTTVDAIDGERYTAFGTVTVYGPGESGEPEEVDLSAYYVELIPGEQVKLMAYVRPDQVSQGVTWSSRDPSVATVDQNGRVTGRASGVTDVVATSRAGELTARCQVVVSDSYDGKPIAFTDVKEGDYCYDAAAWATCQNLEIAAVGSRLGVGDACTRMEIVRYLWKLMGSPQPSDIENNPFTDVSDSVSNRDNRWAIQWAVEAGVTAGTSETTFSPNMTVTRAQAVTFLHRLAGLPSVTGAAGFSDVASSDWFADAAVWAVQEGITMGTGDNAFSPGRECSRGEILTFLYREFG